MGSTSNVLTAFRNPHWIWLLALASYRKSHGSVIHTSIHRRRKLTPSSAVADLRCHLFLFLPVRLSRKPKEGTGESRCPRWGQRGEETVGNFVTPRRVDHEKLCQDPGQQERRSEASQAVRSKINSVLCEGKGTFSFRFPTGGMLGVRHKVRAYAFKDMGNPLLSKR